jgi:hypothetical protein
MREEYTRQQLEAGDGLLTSGEWTMIWRRPDGTYFTTTKDERVVGACFAGGGRLSGSRRRVYLRWCNE